MVSEDAFTHWWSGAWKVTRLEARKIVGVYLFTKAR
jgi:hypothetical protein